MSSSDESSDGDDDIAVHPPVQIIYGVLDDWSSCLTLNHLLLIGKYFLYTNASDDKRPQFADFITLVHYKIDIERYIAIMTNNSSAFVKKWAKFLT